MAKRAFNEFRWVTKQDRNREAITLNQDQNVKTPTVERESEPLRELLHEEPEIPLFLKDTSDGQKGDAQDEKDKTGE